MIDPTQGSLLCVFYVSYVMRFLGMSIARACLVRKRPLKMYKWTYRVYLYVVSYLLNCSRNEKSLVTIFHIYD